MNRTIQYAIHQDDGTVVSRVGRQLAWPILEYDKIGTDGDFTAPLEYRLETVTLKEARYDWPRLVWTRKIPVQLKNLHRAFWQMKPLPEPAERLPL